MIRITHRHVVFLLAAVACIGLSGLFLPGMNRERQMGQLTAADLGRNAPPQLVLATTALGGFRSFLVAGIWWHAQEMQQEGKFWELVQLYDWIGQLEPHLDTIWAFAGWNMSYNIVAEVHDAQERWQWVWRSIEMMRDKGLEANPRSYIIPERIAWTFYQKIGRETDEYYHDYMHSFAGMIQKDWGSGHPDLQAIAKGPATKEELLKDPKVADLVKRFGGEGIDLVEQFDQIDALLPGVSAELQNRYKHPDYAGALKLIKNFRIRRVIHDVYKMEPAQMAVLEQEFGPMDWRLPEPHAIYWAGLAAGNGRTYRTATNGNDVIDARRDIVYSLESLYRRGTIMSFDSRPGGDLILTMNLDYLAPYDRLLEQLVTYYSTVGINERGGDTVMETQQRFFREAMSILYFAGQTSEATSYYKRLQQRYPSDDYKHLTLDQFVLGQIKSMVTEWGREDKVEFVVDGILLQAYVFQVAGQPQLASSYEGQAKAIWDYYLSDVLRSHPNSPLDKAIPTFDELKLKVVNKILAGDYEQVPVQVVEAMRKLLAERSAAGAETTPTTITAPTTPPPSGTPVPSGATGG